jgi:dTDP-4-amino-4,6-dideoxygalactose transaminase
MPNNRIHLCLAKMSPTGAEQRYIQEAFATNWIAPLGPNVDAFEKELEAFVGGYHVAAVSSCTAAIHLALLLLGVGKGDEVICQSFSFCASSNPVIYCGATPVFVDSEKETWNMSPELLEQAIKDRIAKNGRKPKAIIVVDLYGMPAKWEAIEEIAKRYGIPVIEDAANALGSVYKGKQCGTFGNIATLSFNGNKMITTSGGGAIICKDEATKKRAIFLATQAKEPYMYYEHEKIGFNYRMSNICAGIGRGQMTVANDHIAHHKHVQKLYEELLKEVKGVHVHAQPNTGEYDSNYWLVTITLDPEVKIKGQENAYKTIVQGAVGGAAGVIHVADSATTDCQPNDNVEALRVFMDAAGVEARPVWKPMHKQPVYKNCPAYVNGVSEAIFKVGMCLPAGPYVKDDDVKYIVDSIKAAIVG